MSEQKLVSPLLDGFTLGNAISDHSGVRCYPAIKENTEEKYIVKVISIPASQVQLDALLLTGAYKDPADALDYFKEAADNIEAEAYLLKKLSKLEGFLCYDDLQIVPMENGKLGYEIYLLSSYKRSLDRYMRRHLLTHLEAVNLGLDLCQALAICRRSGHMYVAVKPANIFISKGKEYRIGDLGFVDLDALAYTSLPSRYSSSYVPPEVRDDFKTLNGTVDTYGVGMVLYQVFNDGNLPKMSSDPAEAFPAPANADYELSEIIMKALSPAVSERWQNPVEMGQALISYMQRNTVNNTPLAPPMAILENFEPISIPSNQSPEQKATEDTSESVEENTEEACDPALSEAVGSDEVHVYSEDLNETEISNHSDDIPREEADASAEQKEDEEAFLKLLSKELDEPTDDDTSDEVPVLTDSQDKKTSRKGSWILPVILILVLVLIGSGAFMLYQNYYLQTIDELSIVGTQNKLIVTVRSDMDLSKINVRCTDTYGNATLQPATGGKIVFSDLLPDSLYRIELETSGFHKLIGKTAEIFTTDALTSVVGITAVTGSEDGSALINFTVDGSDPDQWLLICEADGEETLTQSFTGHTVTVKGLAVGKKYTFTLAAANGTEVLGNNTMEFIASRLVMADDLSIVSSGNGTMTARWTQPDDVVIESWTARCYSDNGHEQIKEVTGNEVVFTDINSAEAYTVEVTAFGMTQPTRVSITANPITITNFSVSEDTAGQLDVRWEHSGSAPEGGWLLMYTLDDSDTPNVVKATEASAVISPRISGATYHFELQAADSTSLFANSYHHTCSSAEIFDAHGVSAEKITTYLLKTPEGEWLYDSVGKDALTDSFASGDSISAVLRANIDFYLPHEDIHVLFVIRDRAGNTLSELVAEETMDWYTIWFDGDYHAAELDIPKVPTAPGEYSLSIYFNHQTIATATFHVTE